MSSIFQNKSIIQKFKNKYLISQSKNYKYTSLKSTEPLYRKVVAESQRLIQKNQSNKPGFQNRKEQKKRYRSQSKIEILNVNHKRGQLINSSERMQQIQTKNASPQTDHSTSPNKNNINYSLKQIYQLKKYQLPLQVVSESMILTKESKQKPPKVSKLPDLFKIKLKKQLQKMISIPSTQSYRRIKTHSSQQMELNFSLKKINEDYIKFDKTQREKVKLLRMRKDENQTKLNQISKSKNEIIQIPQQNNELFQRQKNSHEKQINNNHSQLKVYFQRHKIIGHQRRQKKKNRIKTQTALNSINASMNRLQLGLNGRQLKQQSFQTSPLYDEFLLNESIPRMRKQKQKLQNHIPKNGQFFNEKVQTPGQNIEEFKKLSANYLISPWKHQLNSQQDGNGFLFSKLGK